MKLTQRFEEILQINHTHTPRESRNVCGDCEELDQLIQAVKERDKEVVGEEDSLDDIDHNENGWAKVLVIRTTRNGVKDEIKQKMEETL